MARSRRAQQRSTWVRWVVVAVVAIAVAGAAVGVVACRKPKPAAVTQQSVATETVTPTESPNVEASETTEPTATPAQSDVVDVGPLHVPQPGTAERQALADAARVLLDTSSRFVVNQMYSDDAWAVAQLTPQSGGASRFVAFRHQPSGWVGIWSGPVPGDGSSAIKGLDDRFESEVLKAIKWKGVSGGEQPSNARPSNSDAIAAAKKYAKGAGGSSISGAELLGMTKDSKGRWWAWVSVQGPANVDPLTVYEYKTGGAWKLWDLGTDPKPVPSDVKF